MEKTMQRHGFDPWSGKRPQVSGATAGAARLLSLRARSMGMELAKPGKARLLQREELPPPTGKTSSSSKDSHSQK